MGEIYFLFWRFLCSDLTVCVTVNDSTTVLCSSQSRREQCKGHLTVWSFVPQFGLSLDKVSLSHRSHNWPPSCLGVKCQHKAKQSPKKCMTSTNMDTVLFQNKSHPERPFCHYEIWKCDTFRKCHLLCVAFCCLSYSWLQWPNFSPSGNTDSESQSVVRQISSLKREMPSKPFFRGKIMPRQRNCCNWH